MTKNPKCKDPACNQEVVWQIFYSKHDAQLDVVFACVQHLREVIESCPGEGFTCLRIEKKVEQLELFV